MVGGVTERTNQVGQQRRRVMPRPHKESSIAPTEVSWKRRRTQRKREKHRKRRGFLLVSESVLTQLQTTQTDCSRHQSAMNRIFVRQSTKEGEPKLHLNILRILVTAAESCRNHRQQTG